MIVFFCLQLISYFSIFSIQAPFISHNVLLKSRDLVEFKMLNLEGLVRVFVPEWSLKEALFGKTEDDEGLDDLAHEANLLGMVAIFCVGLTLLNLLLKKRI